MVYKRYIKKDGKVYGPYSYHSQKKDGKVISKYIGKIKESKKKDKISLKKVLTFTSIIFIFIVGVFLVSLLEKDFLDRKSVV